MAEVAGGLSPISQPPKIPKKIMECCIMTGNQDLTLLSRLKTFWFFGTPYSVPLMPKLNYCMRVDVIGGGGRGGQKICPLDVICSHGRIPTVP